MEERLIARFRCKTGGSRHVDVQNVLFGLQENGNDVLAVGKGWLSLKYGESNFRKRVTVA